MSDNLKKYDAVHDLETGIYSNLSEIEESAITASQLKDLKKAHLALGETIALCEAKLTNAHHKPATEAAPKPTETAAAEAQK